MKSKIISQSSPKTKARAGAVLQTGAALLWLPQAGLLAYALGLVMKGGALTQVIWIAAAVLMLGTVRAALDAAGSRIAFKAARETLAALRERAVVALMHRSPLDNSRPASGLAASAIAEQAEAVIPYLSRFQPVRQRVSVVPLVILAVVLWFSWVAALILLVAAPLIPVFMALIGWRAKAASEAQLAELGGMNGFLLDRLRGLSTIRAFDAVDLTARRLRGNAESLRQRTMAVLRIAFLSSAVLELFSALGVAMVAVYTGFHLLGQLDFGAWGGKLTLPESVFILLLAPAFFEPLRDLSAVWHDRASGEAAMKALEELGDEGVAMMADVAPHASSDAWADDGNAAPAVELSNLRFRHAGSDNLLFDNFNLTVSPGEHVALWGPSGCGKSTLLALMAGLVTPEEGHIALCGVPLLPETMADIRARMAWVGQKPHIFAGSAAANITLGRDGDKVDIEAALEVANLTDVVRNRAALGESGIGLSGGEALRLSLARAAFNTEAAIILADEPTAHLDHQTALKVTDSLLALAKGKTLIVATHDPALALRMDRLIRLDAGRRA
ncbi:thiol reductant ABC exporter subunit CydD [Brucella sp. IR073]|uniref:thiol reductant ABC exporter subunit CydD n=1 Tax=unclassified Brucella TaxID=2632610 RepID=UPI003B97D356